MTGKELQAYYNGHIGVIQPKVTYKEGCKVLTTYFDYAEYDAETYLWTFRTKYGIIQVREENVLRVKLR